MTTAGANPEASGATVGGAPPPSTPEAQLVSLGAVAKINALIPSRRRLPVGALLLWIQPAIAVGQCRIFFDHKQQPIGYITWGYLSASVAKRVSNDSSTILHPSEWNEGGNLWIMDVAILDRRALRELRAMLIEWGQQFRAVSYARSDRSGGDVKRLALRARTIR